MKLLVILLTLSLAVATVSAQRGIRCRKMLVVGHAGQTFCEKQCTRPGRPGSDKCLRLRTASTFRICPNTCCRLGDSCHRLLRA